MNNFVERKKNLIELTIYYYSLTTYELVSHSRDYYFIVEINSRFKRDSIKKYGPGGAFLHSRRREDNALFKVEL